MFPSQTRFIDWSLSQNCFDLSSESAFKKHLKDALETFESEKAEAFKQLKEKENQDMDDPLATNTVISFELEAKHQINVDLERTEFFVKGMDTRACYDYCFEILFPWSMKHRKLGYRQGMNEVISILMKVVFDFQLCPDLKENVQTENQQDNMLENVTQKKTSFNSSESKEGKPIFEVAHMTIPENENELKEIFSNKQFLCALLFNKLFENGIKEFYNFESKGVKKMDLFLHQTVHKIFKKRLKVSCLTTDCR
jgi:hypothetical protein